MEFKEYLNLPFEISALSQSDFQCKTFNSVSFYTNSKMGYSLEINSSSKPILSTIHFYGPQFSSVTYYKSDLPFNLKWVNSAEEIVCKFGEPVRKEGGKGVEIRLGYDNLGIEITLSSKIWQDSQAKIAAIALFKENSNIKGFCSVCRADTNPGINCKCKNLKFCSEKCKYLGF